MTSYDSNNVFAKIIRGEVPCKKVYEDERLLAFYDASRAAPVHILVIPKGEFRSFEDFVAMAPESDITYFFKKIKDIAHNAGVKDSGYRLLTNIGSDASQTVHHFHVHIIGGKKLGGLLPNDNLTR